MKDAMDRLFDMITRDSLWWTAPASTPTVTFAKVDTTEEMRLVPDTPNGPMLEIAHKNGQGVELFKRRLNLAAVDDLIGKLIKMRDHMAQMGEG